MTEDQEKSIVALQRASRMYTQAAIFHRERIGGNDDMAAERAIRRQKAARATYLKMACEGEE